MIKGSCLCGKVKFEISGEISLMANCHCSMCRKNHGAPYVTYAGVDASQLSWVQGEDLIADYQSSEKVHRGFCRECGSNLPLPGESGGQIFIPAGSLDDDPGVKPQVHIFVASKAPWVEINDDLPQFDAFPPGFDD